MSSSYKLSQEAINAFAEMFEKGVFAHCDCPLETKLFKIPPPGVSPSCPCGNLYAMMEPVYEKRILDQTENERVAVAAAAAGDSSDDDENGSASKSHSKKPSVDKLFAANGDVKKAYDNKTDYWNKTVAMTMDDAHVAFLEVYNAIEENFPANKVMTVKQNMLNKVRRSKTNTKVWTDEEIIDHFAYILKHKEVPK